MVLGLALLISSNMESKLLVVGGRQKAREIRISKKNKVVLLKRSKTIKTSNVLFKTMSCVLSPKHDCFNKPVAKDMTICMQKGSTDGTRSFALSFLDFREE